jgi:hypothetical protein
VKAIGFWFQALGALFVGLPIAISILQSPRAPTAWSWRTIGLLAGFFAFFFALGTGLRLYSPVARFAAFLESVATIAYFAVTWSKRPQGGLAYSIGYALPAVYAAMVIVLLAQDRSGALFQARYRELVRSRADQQPRMFQSPFFYVPGLFLAFIGTLLVYAFVLAAR